MDLKDLYGECQALIFLPVEILFFPDYDGRKWNTLRSDNLFLKSLWAESPEKIFAASYDSKEKTNAVIWHDGKNRNIAGSKWNERINAVTGNSGSDIFAAGGDEDNGGIIRHYNGERWETAWSLKNDSQLSKLNGIWCFSPWDIYAVGTNGVILHYDGNKWMPVETPANVDLTDIWAKSQNDIYVTGAKGTILHFDGEKMVTNENQGKANLNGFFGNKRMTTEPGNVPNSCAGGAIGRNPYWVSGWVSSPGSWKNHLLFGNGFSEDFWGLGDKNNFGHKPGRKRGAYYNFERGKGYSKWAREPPGPFMGIGEASPPDIFARGFTHTVCAFKRRKRGPGFRRAGKLLPRGDWGGAHPRYIFIPRKNGEGFLFSGPGQFIKERGLYLLFAHLAGRHNLLGGTR